MFGSKKDKTPRVAPAPTITASSAIEDDAGVTAVTKKKSGKSGLIMAGIATLGAAAAGTFLLGPKHKLPMAPPSVSNPQPDAGYTTALKPVADSSTAPDITVPPPQATIGELAAADAQATQSGAAAPGDTGATGAAAAAAPEAPDALVPPPADTGAPVLAAAEPQPATITPAPATPAAPIQPITAAPTPAAASGSPADASLAQQIAAMRADLAEKLSAEVQRMIDAAMKSMNSSQNERMDRLEARIAALEAGRGESRAKASADDTGSKKSERPAGSTIVQRTAIKPTRPSLAAKVTASPVVFTSGTKAPDSPAAARDFYSFEIRATPSETRTVIKFVGEQPTATLTTDPDGRHQRLSIPNAKFLVSPPAPLTAGVVRRMWVTKTGEGTARSLRWSSDTAMKSEYQVVMDPAGGRGVLELVVRRAGGALASAFAPAAPAASNLPMNPEWVIQAVTDTRAVLRSAVARDLLVVSVGTEVPGAGVIQKISSSGVVLSDRFQFVTEASLNSIRINATPIQTP